MRLCIVASVFLCLSAFGAVRKKVVAKRTHKFAASLRTASRKAVSPWRVPTYAQSTTGDEFDGDDPLARSAAVAALGGLNGTVVISKADTGRILTIVNQKLAFDAGFQPCSTVKVPVALAALRELLIDRSDLVRVGKHQQLDMTQALAHSNNQYFAKLGGELGFERVSSYAKLFGLGEKAGLGMEREKPGTLPALTPASGIGMMTSFGDGIRVTPLQLSALVGAVANGGTLYYLQYPQSAADAEKFAPEIKRKLDISSAIPDIMPGMMGAVDFGTARRIGTNHEEPIYGKTGTCTDSRTPTHLGWFSSFSAVDGEKLVVTVLLTGGRGVSGPAAAGVAGGVYRRLNLR